MVYIDIVILINLVFDFTLINLVDLLLKRNSQVYRLLLAAIVGEASLVTLFINFSNIEGFIFKVLLGTGMCIVAFGYRNTKYTLINSIYLYLSGIILGGFMTYIYNEFKINRDYSIKYIIVLILGLVFIFIYYKSIVRFKVDYRNRYKVEIDYSDIHYEGIGFLDSGNKLVSPYSGKPIILVEKEYISLHRLKIIPIPYSALNYTGIINCFKPDNVVINGKHIDDILIGLSDKSFNIEGVSILLNAKVEGI